MGHNGLSFPGVLVVAESDRIQLLGERGTANPTS